MIIVVGGIKGGSGKTTVSTNLAVMRANAGKDVLLVDADDQETASDFTALRNEMIEDGAGYTSIKLTGASVRTEIQKMAPKYDDVIIDTGGRDTTSQRAALSIANLMLIPFVPRSFDVWTLERVGQVVDEMRAANPELVALAFLNRADARGQDNDDAMEVLKDTNAISFIDTPLGMRKAYSNAAAHGLSVTELKPLDQKACDEVTKLYRYSFDTKLELYKNENETLMEA